MVVSLCLVCGQDVGDTEDVTRSLILLEEQECRARVKGDAVLFPGCFAARQ